MFRGISIVLIVLVLAAPAGAQPAQPPGMPSLAPGSEVWVVRHGRPVVHGSVFDVSRRALEVLTETGLVEIPFGEIARVQVPGPPSTKAGAILGSVIGGATMATIMAADSASCVDRGGVACLSGTGWTIGGGVAGAVLGALAGATIGSRVRTRHTIYPAPRRAPASISLSPMLARRGAALTASISW